MEPDGPSPGPECAVFVLDEPTPDFVRRALKRDHVWARRFASAPVPEEGEPDEDEAAHDDGPGAEPALAGFSANELRAISNSQIVIGKNNKIVLGEALLEGPAIDPEEYDKVLGHFGLDYARLPCLIWFRDPNDADFRTVGLRKIHDNYAARDYFRSYFRGVPFRKLMNWARLQHV